MARINNHKHIKNKIGRKNQSSTNIIKSNLVMHDLNQLHKQIKHLELLNEDQKLLIKDLKSQIEILRKTILFYENRKIVSLANS